MLYNVIYILYKVKKLEWFLSNCTTFVQYRYRLYKVKNKIVQIVQIVQIVFQLQCLTECCTIKLYNLYNIVCFIVHLIAGPGPCSFRAWAGAPALCLACLCCFASSRAPAHRFQAHCIHCYPARARARAGAQWQPDPACCSFVWSGMVSIPVPRRSRRRQRRRRWRRRRQVHGQRRPRRWDLEVPLRHHCRRTYPPYPTSLLG